MAFKLRRAATSSSSAIRNIVMMKQTINIQRLRVLACAAASLLLAACPFDKPEEHLARGKEMAAKQDHNGAAIEFKNVLQSNPKSAEVRFLLGRELLAQGEARAAEIELQKAYDGRFDRDTVVPLLVESQILQGQPERIAPRIAGTELGTPLANARLQSLLGTAALFRGKTDDALKAFRSALQFVSYYPAARIGEARIKAMRGELDDANNEVASVLAQDPKNVEGLILKGDIARTKGATQEAIDAYAAAAQLNPRSIAARLNLVSAYMVNNTTDLAQQQMIQLKKLAPRHPGVNYLDALIAFNKKDYLRANDAIATSLSENPVSGVAQILSGAISIAMNQPAQGEVHLVEGIKLSPNSIYARRLLGTLYLRQRQPQKASDVLQPALNAVPDDPALLGLAGELAVQMGDFNNASKYFDRASKIDPSNTAVRVRAASIDLARGEEAAGFAALEAAAKASSNNPTPDIALVIAHLNRKEYDQALASWKNLEKTQSDKAITYNLRAAIDLGRNDRASARKALERALQLQPNYFPVVNNLAALDESEGNLDAARGRYRTLLEKEKTNSVALIALAQFEMKHGAKSDVVLPLLLDAHRTNPTEQRPVIALVNYYISQNDGKRALLAAQEGLSRAPNDVIYLNMVGTLQMQNGGVDQAIAAYRQLIVLQPNVIEYQIRLGQAMVQANQADLGLPVFQNALRSKPDDAPAQSAAVNILLVAGKIDEATRLLADIRRTSPKSPALPELDGDIKLVSRQYAEATAAYRKLLADKPSSQLVIKTYGAMSSGGNTPEASAFLADWVKNHPKDLTVRVFDANAALQAKNYPRAVDGYRAALAVTPNDAGVLNNLAYALWQQKDPQALSYAERANDIAPNLPTVSDTLGWMLVEQGETKRGLQLLERAAAAAPAQRTIALHLAKAQIKDGRKDAARSTLQALVKAAPASPEGKESKDLMATL
jgi:putative PEP-CTERM system TPR-repeat lipoprotein